MKTHGVEIITPGQVFRQGDDNKILLHIEFGMADVDGRPKPRKSELVDLQELPELR